MTVKENLMLVAMEEATEIGQELSKTMRFGANNFHPDNPEETNGFKLLKEFYQLGAMIEYLQGINELPVLSEEEIKKIKEEKIIKVFKYMEVSKDLGFLDNKEVIK